jgi:hypothetical protein
MDGTPATDIGTAKPHPAERRRHQRAGVMIMATLRTGRGFIECMVLDLSSGGAKLAFGEEIVLPPGHAVALIIGRIGTFRAQAVWQRTTFTGIRFLDPPETIAQALGDMLPS